MSILEILFIMLTIIGIVGAMLIVLALLFFLYGWIETKLLKRRIPDKIKKEVEDERYGRKSRREQAGRDIAGGSASYRTDDQVTQQRDVSLSGPSNTTRKKSDSQIHWTDFS